MISIEQAIILAATAHSNQKDLEGRPAILHPLRVMIRGSSEDERIVGVLHDVVEDSKYDFNDLQNAGCTNRQIDALKLLTRRNGIDYLDYVAKIAKSKNSLALVVKAYDLEDNLNRGREFGHLEMVKIHEKALEIIKAVL